MRRRASRWDLDTWLFRVISISKTPYRTCCASLSISNLRIRSPTRVTPTPSRCSGMSAICGWVCSPRTIGRRCCSNSCSRSANSLSCHPTLTSQSSSTTLGYGRWWWSATQSSHSINRRMRAWQVSPIMMNCLVVANLQRVHLYMKKTSCPNLPFSNPVLLIQPSMTIYKRNRRESDAYQIDNNKLALL